VEALTRATIESVAENTSDAVVAPLVWGGLAGPTGMAAHRAVNTLDAMVGHRTPRHRRSGWAPARPDDLANLVPARLTAALVVVAAALLGEDPAGALRTWWRDGAAHPSPNAGRVEAATAGALRLTLGGTTNVYGHGHVDDRPPLGDGPPPQPADLARARRLATLVGTMAAGVAVGLRLAAAGRAAR